MELKAYLIWALRSISSKCILAIGMLFLAFLAAVIYTLICGFWPGLGIFLIAVFSGLAGVFLVYKGLKGMFSS